MKQSVYLLHIFLCILLLAQRSNAQNCFNCKEMPRVAGFGFDIQVAQPDTFSQTANLWPEWKNLFMLAGVVSDQIGNTEKGCLRITIPPSVDTGNVQLMSVGGENFVNLPSNSLINSDLSNYGDYILTGKVSGQAGSCISRRRIKKRSFHLSYVTHGRLAAPVLRYA